jgi:hypothetical protein
MRNLIKLLFVLVLCLATGCKEREPEPTFYVDQEVLSFCWFPMGSYWVYEEASMPGMLDSVYNSNPMHLIVKSDGDNYASEGYSCDVKIRGLLVRQGASAEPKWAVDGPSVSYVSEFYSDSISEYHDYVLFKHSDGQNYFSFYPSTTIVQKADSIQILGVTYHDIVEVATSPQSMANFTQNVVWAKDVGVIRRSFVDGTVWNLVRYHINR